MSTEPRREPSSTYVVPDRNSEEECRRLAIQDRLVTASMGGVLAEQPDPSVFARVLDVGCGTGGWIIEAAQAYPSMRQLVGVDISNKILDYARAQARAMQVDDRVEFHRMDALLMLEFPDASFDLVNLRLGMSFLRQWDWRKLLQEFWRVCRPGGSVRLTEAEMSFESTSQSLLRLNRLLAEAFYKAGHLFRPAGDGLTGELTHLLGRAGFQQIQTQTHTRRYRAGTAEGQQFAQDMSLGFRTLVPFLRRWTQVPDDYEIVYQQMQAELDQPDFEATGSYLTAWGRRPMLGV